MRGKSLLIIGSSQAATEGDVVAAVLSHWDEKDLPPIERLSFNTLLEEPDVLKMSAAAWVVADEDPGSRLYEVVGEIQDRQMPALLTRTGESKALGARFQSGVVVAPPTASSETLYAMLRTVWSQTDLVSALKAELRIGQLGQGGLVDQIGKMDEELRMAAQLQREFMPNSLPELNGVAAQVLYRPATYVSGDIYDVIRLDEDHLGFFIADAVGHGVPAALLTVSIKRSLRTKEINRAFSNNYRIVPPDEALAHLNADMIDMQSGKIRTATAAYAILNCRTLEMQFARAGHPFPLLLHADGSTEALDPDGAMLGVFPDEQFELWRFKLTPGDRLLLYSDGFEVAFRDATQGQGTPRAIANQDYLDEFDDLAHGSLEEAIAHLAHKLDQQAGSLNQLDDLTALLVGVPSQLQEPATKATPHVEQSGLLR